MWWRAAARRSWSYPEKSIWPGRELTLAQLIVTRHVRRPCRCSRSSVASLGHDQPPAPKTTAGAERARACAGAGSRQAHMSVAAETTMIGSHALGRTARRIGVRHTQSDGGPDAVR